jgi:uncharacterized protein YndB with AHSA1/START domain
MTNTNETRIDKDPSGKKLIVNRYFNASLDKVWRAWTESSQLDDWWAPKPWKAETKTIDFNPGGLWLYAMVGPTGEKHWCRVDFQAIQRQKSFTVVNRFCDENGNANSEFPIMEWCTLFTSNGAGTTVTVEIKFDSEADLEKIVAMGFKEGFTMAHGNLDQLLAQ